MCERFVECIRDRFGPLDASRDGGLLSLVSISGLTPRPRGVLKQLLLSAVPQALFCKAKCLKDVTILRIFCNSTYREIFVIRTITGKHACTHSSFPVLSIETNSWALTACGHNNRTNGEINALLLIPQPRNLYGDKSLCSSAFIRHIFLSILPLSRIIFLASAKKRL